MVRQTTNIHWLRVAIHICGGRPALAKLCKVGESCMTKWLNEEREINLQNAIKIEKATNGRVTRDQLISDRDKTFKSELKKEVEIIKQSQSPLTFKERVELGLAHEAALGCRKGARTDLKLSKNFNEVQSNNQERLPEKSILHGRTEQLAAELAGFGNFITYHQAKKIHAHGIPELINAVEKGLPISRAVKVCEHPPEKQVYFLTLDRASMIKALSEAICKKKTDKWKSIHNANCRAENKSVEENLSCHESTAAWALLSFNMTLFQNKKSKTNSYEKNLQSEEKAILKKNFK